MVGRNQNPKSWSLLLGLAVVGLVFLIGCSSDHQVLSPAPADEQSLAPRDGNSDGSVDCWRDNGNDRDGPLTHAERWIGSRGGVLALNGHLLTVPAGAVSTYTLFTLDVAEGAEVGVECGPSGCQFAIPVQLTLNYAGSQWDGGDGESNLHIWWIPDGGDWDDRVDQGGVVNRLLNRVTAPLSHFSRYIVG